jgi:hypothetical protein
MAPPISDAVVVDVLRRVDRLTTPLVRRLGRPPELPQAERDRWWAERVSSVAAGASALPRFAGKLADLLPLQNALGAAVQSVVVLGVAGARVQPVAPAPATARDDLAVRLVHVVRAVLDEAWIDLRVFVERPSLRLGERGGHEPLEGQPAEPVEFLAVALHGPAQAEADCV